MMGIAAIIKALAQIAWPIAFVILGVIFKADFRSFLTSLGKRGWSFKAPGGFEATVAEAEQQQLASDNPAAEKLPEKPTLDPSPRPAVNIIEARIRDELKSFESEKKEAVLLRALAQSRLESGHEFTYNRIFGSQILALKRLNEVGRVTVDDALEFFKPYAEQFPAVYRSYGFEGWLGFLKNNALVQQNDNILEITHFGRDFLIYVTEKRLVENKAL